MNLHRILHQLYLPKRKKQHHLGSPMMLFAFLPYAAVYVHTFVLHFHFPLIYKFFRKFDIAYIYCNALVYLFLLPTKESICHLFFNSVKINFSNTPVRQCNIKTVIYKRLSAYLHFTSVSIGNYIITVLVNPSQEKFCRFVR